MSNEKLLFLIYLNILKFHNHLSEPSMNYELKVRLEAGNHLLSNPSISYAGDSGEIRINSAVQIMLIPSALIRALEILANFGFKFCIAAVNGVAQRALDGFAGTQALQNTGKVAHTIA